MIRACSGASNPVKRGMSSAGHAMKSLLQKRRREKTKMGRVECDEVWHLREVIQGARRLSTESTETAFGSGTSLGLLRKGPPTPGSTELENGTRSPAIVSQHPRFRLQMEQGAWENKRLGQLGRGGARAFLGSVRRLRSGSGPRNEGCPAPGWSLRPMLSFPDAWARL